MKLKVINILQVLILLLTVSCKEEYRGLINEEPFNPLKSGQQSSINELNAVSDDMFLSQEQLATIHRLETINDSVAYANGSEPGIASKIDFQLSGVIAADAKGFYDGFRHGWQCKRNLLGKFATATLEGTLTGILYSAIAVAQQLGQGLINKPPYSVNDLTNVMGETWTNGSVDHQLESLLDADPSLEFAGTTDQLKLSILHNAALTSLENHHIYPQDMYKKLFSEEQYQYLKSNQFMDFYNAMPRIINGTASINMYINPATLRYETRIISTFENGIHKLKGVDTEDMYEATRDLCHAYIETISDDNTITAEVKPNIISTLYIAPLSARHWTIENPQFK